MNRDIKFKVWDIDNKRMFNDCFSLKNKGTAIWVQFENQSSNNLIWLQYTGIKDKNGKEIFEGDIVLENWSDFDERKSIVEYDEVNPCFVLKRIDNKYKFIDYEYDFVKCDLMKLEVIGNIYENKELLDN